MTKTETLVNELQVSLPNVHAVSPEQYPTREQDQKNGQNAAARNSTAAESSKFAQQYDYVK